MIGAIGEKLAGRTALHIPAAAGVKILKGDFVAIGADGYAVPVSKATGLINAGQAVSDADNTGGDAGAVYVDTERGTLIYGNEGDITEKDLLKECYFSAADKVSLTGKTASSRAGIIVAADEGSVAVDTL